MSENVTQADREREFGRAVVLDTDLRKLHAEGRTSDAIRRINDALRAAEIAGAQRGYARALEDAARLCASFDPAAPRISYLTKEEMDHASRERL